MDKFYSKITCRLIDAHLAPDESQLTEIDHICDMSDMQSAVCQILEQQKAGNYILVVTDSADICNLVLAFNPTFKDHKLSVLCGDVLHAEDAVAEMERLEKLLHTESNISYYPEKEVEDGLFLSDNGFLLLHCGWDQAKSVKNQEILYSSDGQMWGCVLPYPAASLIGKLHNHIESMTFAERTTAAAAVLTCFKEEHLTESVFLFKTEEGLVLQPAGTQNINTNRELFVLLYEIFFGHTPSKDRMLSLIEDRTAHPESPALLFEFFEFAFSDKIYPGLSCKSATLDLLENTLYRLTWFTIKEA